MTILTPSSQGEMSRPQFLSLMETRPLCFKFVINPLKNRQLHESPQEAEEGETDYAGKTPPVASCSSTASASDDEKADDTTLQEGQVKTRQSLSDWYLEQDEAAPDLTGRKGSVGFWYLDGQRPSDGQSRLTSHHRLRASVPLTDTARTKYGSSTRGREKKSSCGFHVVLLQ